MLSTCCNPWYICLFVQYFCPLNLFIDFEKHISVLLHILLSKQPSTIGSLYLHSDMNHRSISWNSAIMAAGTTDLVVVMETIIRVSYKIMVWRTVSSFDIQKAMVNNVLYGSVYSSIWHQVLSSNFQCLNNVLCIFSLTTNDVDTSFLHICFPVQTALWLHKYFTTIGFGLIWGNVKQIDLGIVLITPLLLQIFPFLCKLISAI